MQLLKIYYAYFSPGNTTEKVVSHIASSFQNYPVESINLTDYASTSENIQTAATKVSNMFYLFSGVRLLCQTGKSEAKRLYTNFLF